MIAAPLVHVTYLILVFILTIHVSKKYSYLSQEEIIYGDNCNTMSLLIPIGFALFIGFRPLSRVFGDMGAYEEVYRVLIYGKEYQFSWDTENYLFDNIFNWLGANMIDIRVFFVGCAFVYFLGTYIGIKKIFSGNALFAFVCFLGAFSTFSYGTNGLKAGLAATFFYIAVSFSKNPILFALFLWISLGFHHSMILPVIAVIMAYVYRNSRVYLIFWVICLVIALLHITYFQSLLGGISEEGNNSYLNAIDSEWGGKTGFRYDFVIYSSIPIITGYYWYIKRNFKDKVYSIIYNTYLLSNGIWMLCMYAAFTNRIAYLSWFLYPLVLIYPLFNFRLFDNQSKVLNYTVWGQLIITTGLTII